jgi:hypothetical protein
MRKRFVRRTTFGLLAGVAAAVAVAGMGSVAAAVLPTGTPASASQYKKKVTICHRTHSKKKPFHTIRVSPNAVPAHLRHGDARGPCGTAVFTMCHKAKGGKHQKTFKVKGARKAQRHLKKGDKLGKCKGKPEKSKGKGKSKEKNKGHGKKKGGGPKKP